MINEKIMFEGDDVYKKKEQGKVAWSRVGSCSVK